MKQYNVYGMSCSACVSRVEKAVKGVPGVTGCAVSLLTNQVGVDGSPRDEDIISAITKAGYEASLKESKSPADDSILEDKETPALKRRLISSVILLAVVMYISMGQMMAGLPGLPLGMDGLMAVTAALTLAIMVINGKFYVSGIGSLIHGSPNMDTLVALGSGASFLAVFAGEMYFESAAMILTLVTVGKLMEARAKSKTTSALKSLIRLAPDMATVVREGQEVKIPVSQMQQGDMFIVRPGENVPVDGIIKEGVSAVNEAAITGESIPVDKFPGDSIYSATSNTSGHLVCRATKVGEDTTLAKIIKLVSDAQTTKAPIAGLADKVSGIFVPVVMALAAAVFGIWMLAGAPVQTAVKFAISVLVISCPCALGLATPVAIMVGSGMGAKRGILFKTAVSLEESGKASAVVLDKTGTVTSGEPEVTDVIIAPGYDEETLVRLAYSLENLSEHPLARAIVDYAKANHVRTKKVTDFRIISGSGLMGYVDNEPVCGGNLKFISTQIEVPDEMVEMAETLALEGKSPMYFAKGEELAGIIAVADTIKEDTKDAVAEMKKLGIEVIMLTGDNKKTAASVGKKIGVDRIYAGVLPADKQRIVDEIAKEKGTDSKVIMVGDGINDAPALTTADIGIAIGAGTDVAIDAADIVLMNSSLSDVAAIIKLSRATLRNIKQNLFWAFCYNVLGIPVAAGVLMPICGIALSPVIASACMSLSSICVVTNALRLNTFDMDKRTFAYLSEGEIIINTRKEEKQMKKTMKIEGMMCAHCQGRVKDALEGLAQVSEAAVSHEEDQAVVTLSENVDEQVLKEAVEAQGYKVTEIK